MLLLLPKDKNGLVFLSGVMYPIHPRCRTSAASSAAAFVRAQETAATLLRNNSKQTPSTNGPKTEATGNLWGFWKTSKTLPQHHILHLPSPKPELLSKRVFFIHYKHFVLPFRTRAESSAYGQDTGSCVRYCAARASSLTQIIPGDQASSCVLWLVFLDAMQSN